MRIRITTEEPLAEHEAQQFLAAMGDGEPGFDIPPQDAGEFDAEDYSEGTCKACRCVVDLRDFCMDCYSCVDCCTCGEQRD